MNSLVASNLSHHPGRTLASVIGVAVGVILVVLTVGLVRGKLRDRGQRDANIGVEIIDHPGIRSRSRARRAGSSRRHSRRTKH